MNDRYILQYFPACDLTFQFKVSLRSLSLRAAFGLSTQSVDIKGFQDNLTILSEANCGF